jgi:hypothetical protein
VIKTVLSSQFSVLGSQFSVLSSQFSVLGSRLVLRSWFFVLREKSRSENSSGDRSHVGKEKTAPPSRARLRGENSRARMVTHERAASRQSRIGTETSSWGD